MFLGAGPTFLECARFEIGYRAFVAELSDGEAAAQREVAKLLEAAERALRTTAHAERSRPV